MDRIWPWGLRNFYTSAFTVVSPGYVCFEQKWPQFSLQSLTSPKKTIKNYPDKNFLKIALYILYLQYQWPLKCWKNKCASKISMYITRCTIQLMICFDFTLNVKPLKPVTQTNQNISDVIKREILGQWDCTVCRATK